MEPLFIGIDWSEAKHDVCILNQEGAILQEFIIEQATTGYTKLSQQISHFQVNPANCFIAIETAYNLLLDFLLAKQYTVYVLPPNMVVSNRSRFGSSGRRNDRSDAHLIADICRTDQQRLTPWQKEGRQINQMKALLRLIDDLTQSTTRFRRGCNYEFRHTSHCLAVTSVAQSTWAATYFQQARERGLAKSQAYRCLANRWLAIIWTLWQRNQTYDESYHLQQVQRQRQQVAV